MNLDFLKTLRLWETFYQKNLNFCLKKKTFILGVAGISSKFCYFHKILEKSVKLPSKTEKNWRNSELSSFPHLPVSLILDEISKFHNPYHCSFTCFSIKHIN